LRSKKNKQDWACKLNQGTSEMTKTFKKSGANITASIYVSDDKEKLILLPVNRSYNQTKKPVFYLKRGKGNQKPEYLSGLFATKDSAVFSGDTKNPITGVKQLFKVTFQDGGETLVLEGLSW
jgi:hypothetical protein